MSAFQKLIAIPQEEYIQLNTVQQVHQPLQQQMNHLLTQQQQFLNPYDQMMKQGTQLEQVKVIKEKIRDSLSLGTPKPYRNRALSLYKSMEPYVQYNERGEMLDDQQNPIKESRAEDLIQHAVRDRRRNFVPAAWDTFLKKIEDHNIPKTYLNRQTIEELKSQPKPPTPSTSEKKKRKSGLILSKTKSASLPKKRVRKSSTRYPESQFLTKF